MKKQQSLPGTTDPRTQELLDVAEAFFDVDEHRKRLSKECAERKDDIVAVMTALKRKTFTDVERGVTITLTPVSVKVKVVKVREKRKD